MSFSEILILYIQFDFAQPVDNTFDYFFKFNVVSDQYPASPRKIRLEFQQVFNSPFSFLVPSQLAKAGRFSKMISEKCRCYEILRLQICLFVFSLSDPIHPQLVMDIVSIIRIQLDYFSYQSRPHVLTLPIPVESLLVFS